jgi:hypothetical protein
MSKKQTFPFEPYSFRGKQRGDSEGMARRKDGWGDGDKIKIGVCVMEKKVSGWTLEKLMIRCLCFFLLI